MNEDRKINIRVPDELATQLVQNILDTSDEEILSEVREQYKNVENEVEDLRLLISAAVQKSKKMRLIEARKQVNAIKKQSSGQILNLPLSAKERIIKRAKESVDDFTLAARNADNMSEGDVDTTLEDLIELGVIDEDGNLL